MEDSSDVIVGDLMLPFEKRLQGGIDVLLFNPPYVPSESSEIRSHGIEAAWAGGARGREVIDRFIPLVPV
jgi:release factor glutamine methyltransferase